MTKHLIKHTTALLIASIIGLISWEYSIRVLFPQKVVPNYMAPTFGMRYGLIPKLQIDMLNHSHYPPYRIVTNQKGLRSLKPISYEKTPNTYRILFLGDSIFFGYGANNEETISFQLEQLLNKNFPGEKLEVINYSVMGWGILDYYLYYQNEGKKYNSDLIVISQFTDDLRQDFTTLTTFKNITLKNNIVHLEGMRVNLPAPSIVAKVMGWFAQSPFYNSLSQFSHLLYLARINLNKIRDSDSSFTNPSGYRLDHFLKSHPDKNFQEITWNQDGYEFQIPEIVNNPIQFFGNKSGVSPEVIRANTVLYFAIFNSLLHSIKQNEAKTILLEIPSYPETLKLTNPNQFPSPQYDKDSYLKLNLLKPFSRFTMESDVPIFYQHDNHWSPAGHRLGAQILYNFLISNNALLPNSLSKPPILDILSQTMKLELEKANHRVAKKLNADPFQTFVKAIQYKNKNQLEKAKNNLEKYLAIKPNDYEASFELGLIFLMQKNYANAESYFFKAQQYGNDLEKPKYKRFYIYAKNFGKAWSLIQKGEFKNAIPYLITVSKLEGHFQEEAKNMLAMYYLKQGDIKMANFYKNNNKSNSNFENILKQKLEATIGK